MIKVTFINNMGGGYGMTKDVPDGTTIDSFLRETLGEGFDPHSYKISVNRSPVAASYTLVDGDRISATPTKIEGAGR